MNRKIFFAFLLSTVFSISAQETKEIEEVTVVGSRISVNQKDLPQKIEVLHRKDLENTMANDITDYLKKLASVNIIQYPHGFSYAKIKHIYNQSFKVYMVQM